MLRFSDGEEFDTSKPIHVEHRLDGWYIVGGGILQAVNSEKEGKEFIRKMEECNAENKTGL